MINMHYEDLKPYVIGSNYIYPKMLNIGWLGVGINYPLGNISAVLLSKLKFITLLDLDQSEDSAMPGISIHPLNIIVHTSHCRRGLPFACPFCEQEIEITDSNDRKMLLGNNEMCIPNKDKTLKYNCPTMLIQYIDKHQYLPPIQFLKALENFDLNVPYDCHRDGI